MKQRLLYLTLFPILLSLTLFQIAKIPVSSASPHASIFPDAPNVLALFEFDGNVSDSSGNGNDAVFIGGRYVSTPLGQGLKLSQGEAGGIDWSAHASQLVHPYTVEIVLTPQNTANWKKLFSFDDQSDNGWYYLNDGIQAYPHAVLGQGEVIGNQLHYLAFVSTAADQVDVYFQGELIGSTPATFTAPPTQAIFFKDDTITGGSEGLEAVVEAVRISSQTRTLEEMAAVQTLLTGASSISGAVTNSNQEPLAGIVVNAYQRLGDDLWVSGGTTETNESGQYTISGLFSGTYRVHFGDTTGAYRPEYYDDVTSIDTATEIAVASETAVSGIDAVLADPEPPQIGVSGPTVGVDPATGEVTISVPRGFQETVTISREITCETGSPSNVQLLIGTTAFPMTAGDGDTYSVTLTTPDDLPATTEPSLIITIEYTCDGTPTTTPPVGEFVLYDPSGDVTDAETGDLIEGAVVNLYRIPNAIPDRDGLTNDCRTVDTRPADATGTFGAWSAVPQAAVTDGVWVNPDFGSINATPEISPTVNPQVTGENGRYAWDVAEGCWYVEVAAEGYETIVSPLVGVPPEVTDLDVALTRVMTGGLTYLPYVQKPIPAQTVPDATACKLPDNDTHGAIGLGVPRSPGRLPSVGTARTKVIFVDFPDVPATKTPQEVFGMVSPGSEQFFASVSYGRMNYVLEPHLEWYRMSKNSADYNWGTTVEAVYEYMEEAIGLADPDVNFAGADQILIMANPDAAEIFNGPAHFGPLTYDGTTFTSIVTSGHDLNFWGFLWLNHESGHNLGMIDLYSYSGGHPYVGGFDLMGLISGAAPEFMAHHRWMMDWLDDSQIFCQQTAEETVYLTPVETAGGVKALMVPVDPTKLVVVESRRAVGYDSALPKEGALVYVVDSSISTGQGGIEIFPKLSDPLFYDSPLAVGESVTVEGVTIEVISANSAADQVRVTVSN